MRSQQTQWPSLSRAAWQLLILLPGQHPRQGQSFPSITSAMRHAPSQPRAQADVAFCGDGSQDAANPRCLALNHSMEHSPNPHNCPDSISLACSLLGTEYPSTHPMTTFHFARRCQGPQPACAQDGTYTPSLARICITSGLVTWINKRLQVHDRFPCRPCRAGCTARCGFDGAMGHPVCVHRHLHMYLPTLRP